MTLGGAFFRLGTDRAGASAAEFALVLPLLILLLFGIIDAGRLLYEVNRAEKATQMGARYAIVTNVIPTQVIDEDYTGTANCDDDGDGTYENCVTGSDVRNPAALGLLTCTSSSCICTTSPCPSNAAIPAASFTNLVNRMKAMRPDIAAANVQVQFRGSGVGFAGDPTGMDVVPLVTVRLVDMQFRPIVLFGAITFSLPAFATTLSAEDSVGTQAN
jgi:Flp pilus assembly protein TadG